MEWNSFRSSQKGSGKSMRELSGEYAFYRSKPSYTFSQRFSGERPVGADAFDVLSNDEIYEIAKNLDYRGLKNLCSSTKRIRELCKTQKRFRDLLDVKYEEDVPYVPYSSSGESGESEYLTESSSESSDEPRMAQLGERKG